MRRRQERLREGLTSTVVGRRPPALRRVWSAAVETVFPTRCLLCGRAHQGSDASRTGVCIDCRRLLASIDPPTCDRCGVGLISERSLCTRCREVEYAFERNVALYVYRGAVRDLIHQYKMVGHRRVAALFAEVLTHACERVYPGIPLVPVPGRLSTWRKRGWEHVDELARHMERLGVCVVRCLERRSRSAQKALDYEARLANIRGTMSARAGGVPREAVLLDDVMTTGATLHECARVLRVAGCDRVLALTIAVDE